MSAAPMYPARLTGRCANGFERDRGSRIHAHPDAALLSNQYVIGAALCGAEPGSRSGGWSHAIGAAITCPRCLRKAAKS